MAPFIRRDAVAARKRDAADLSVPIRVPIWIASESQTTHPRSLHRLRCDVQNIITRTDGPRSWRELGPCEIRLPCMYHSYVQHSGWVQAAWVKCIAPMTRGSDRGTTSPVA